MLGILTEEGYPVEEMGVMATEQAELFGDDMTSLAPYADNAIQKSGKACPECGAHTLIKKDGCEFCTTCGHVGSCG
jgi:ribonucleoside-diphosphate reductase alpha chain